MATRRLKRPRDPVELGKLIGDILTGQVEDRDTTAAPRNEVAADMGRKGGANRAKTLSKERRAEIAKKAAESRWAKKIPPERS
jgi:hypothetical protein